MSRTVFMSQELTNAQSFMCIPKPNLSEHKTVQFTFSYTSLDEIYIHCLPSKISDTEHNDHTRFHINSIQSELATTIKFDPKLYANLQL